ncbi:MAG: FtsX-like permease family protein [Promethearchaeota archaeon]
MQLESLEVNLVILIIPIIIGIIGILLWKDKRLIKLALRNLGRRKVRNALTVVGVMASVSLFVAFSISSDNTYQVVYNVIELLGGNVDFEISRIDGEPFDEDILEDILQIEGVKTAAPRIQRYCIIWVFADGNTTAAMVVGIDPKYDNEFGDLLDYNTSEPINDLVIGKNAIVSESLMEGLTRATEDGELVNATVGDSLKIKYRSGGGSVKTKIFDLAAFAEATDKARQVAWGQSVFITLDSAQRFFPKCKDKVDTIVVEMDPAYQNKWQEVQQRIEEVVDEENLTVFAPKQANLEANQSAISGIQAGIFFASVTVLLAMIFLIFNSINMTITERKYEIGVLQSIGFKKRHIFRLFLYEVLALGIAGSAIGVFLGIWISEGLLWYFKTLLNIPIDLAFEEMIGVQVSPDYLLNGFILGVIFTVIGGLYPLISITRTAIINALRPEARTTEKTTLKHRLRWITGGSIFLIAGISSLLVLLQIPEVEIAAGMNLVTFLGGFFIVMAAVGLILVVGGIFKRKYLVVSAGIILLAAGLADVFFIKSFASNYILMVGSIVFTAGILRGISGFFYFVVKLIPGLKYVGSLASKNIARKPTRSTLTFGIFTICLTVVISISSIMVALEAGILDWVDQSLEEDMWINTAVGAPPTLSGNITRHIEGINWANTSEGMIPAITVTEGTGARFELWDDDFDSLLLGVNSTNYAIINQNILSHNIIESTDTDTFKLFKQLKSTHQNACIISDRLAEELHVKVGQKTPIGIWAHGNYTEFKVIGIMHNDIFGYPQPGFFAIIDIDKYYDFGFDKIAHTISIKLNRRYPNGTEVDAQVVADQINERWGDEYKLSFSIKEDIKEEIKDQVQRIAAFFNIITYSSIFVGLLVLATTMIKIVSERRREIGLLRTIGIKKAKVMQLIMFESIFLAVIGLILGIIDGYILGYSAVQTLGASLGASEFIMPWNAIAQTTVVALVIAVIGALVPAWQAGRIAPAESLRYTG